MPVRSFGIASAVDIPDSCRDIERLVHKIALAAGVDGLYPDGMGTGT